MVEKEIGFYGWRPLSGVVLTFLVGSGVFFYSFGVLLSFMSTEFGWGRAIVGGALSVALLAFGLPSPLIGASINRFGPRLNIILGNCLVALGLAGTSFATEVWQLYVFFGILVGVGAGFGLYMPCTAIVSNWFVKRQTLAMALLLSAGGVAGFAFPPLVTWMLSSVGWQGTWLTLSAMHFTCSVVIGGLIMVRNLPEVRQLDHRNTASAKVLGARDSERPTSAEGGAVDWRIRDLVRQPMVRLIAAIYITSFLAIGTLTAHQVVYLRDLGYSPITAAFTFSIMAVNTLLGRLAFGVLGNRYDMRHLVVVFYCIQLVGLAILLIAPNLPMIYTYAVLFGISFGGLTVAAPSLIGAYFGRARFVKILSIAFPLGIAVEALGPIMAGAVYDLTGTYVAAFLVVVILCATGLVYSISIGRS